MGERLLSRYQYGVETTRGVAVASTRRFGADIKGVPLDRTWGGVKLASGRRSNAENKRYDSLFVEDSLTFSNAYYQMLPVIFQCSLDGTITPAEQTTSQGDYLWAVAPSLTAANSPDTITLEMGDDTQAFEVEYCMFNRIRIAGDIAQGRDLSPVSVEASYFGRQVTATTFTGSINLPSVEFMTGKTARLYSDAAYANVGTTEVANTLRGFDVEIEVGNHPKWFGSANRYFDSFGESMIRAQFQFVLEGNSSADTIFDAFQAGTNAAIQLRFAGAQIGTGDTHSLELNCYGFWREVTPLNEDSDGNNLTLAVFESMDDGTNMLGVNVTTNINTP